MTPTDIAHTLLEKLAAKSATKGHHDRVMAAAVPGAGVTTEMMTASNLHAHAAVDLAAALDVARMERLARAYLELEDQVRCRTTN